MQCALALGPIGLGRSQLCLKLSPLMRRAVSEAELSILQRQNRRLGTFPVDQPRNEVSNRRNSVLENLHSGRKSAVARTSLMARHRWDFVLHKVLLMNRVARAFQECII
jgi:hypothetical protein